MRLTNDTYHYPSRRHVVYARNGVAHSSVPLAAQIGVSTMQRGGNAVDAALAMAAALPLLEPVSNGLGSDCFALIWIEKDRKLYGINGSGISPAAASAEKLLARGLTAVPFVGWDPVMVPGAPSAWAKIRARFGTMPFSEIMAPAIRYAEEGYPIPETAALQWKHAFRRYSAALEAAEGPAKEALAPWFDCFTKKTPEGPAPYETGDLFRMPDFAETLRSLAATDCESYYRGDLAKKIVAFSEATGGPFTLEDFACYEAEWVTPISTNYRGYDVCEIPPNGHGITALMALNILEGFDLEPHRETVENYHRMIESMKLAFVDAKRYVADARFMKVTPEQLLSKEYAARRRALIGEKALMPEAGDPFCGGTVYFCTADGEGNMVSFIQSNYAGFGSGIVIPGTGISLNDRGANFYLDPESENCLAGRKKAYHTIIPGFLMKDGEAIGPFGVMGGFMQPQGHLQVIVNTVDFGMNPQDALDAPRFQWTGEKKIELEGWGGVAEDLAGPLAERGHDIAVNESSLDMGRGGIIWRQPNGVYAAGTECRCDGTIAAY
ncbi:MAG: gamma-glutamyltransferase family protein [Eubacterium sp.]|nr:gamma-glutamyltransferase family protein [Eubacterium sp.]